MICHWERGVSCSGPASNANAWEPIMFLLAVKDAQKQLLSDLDCFCISRCGWGTNMFLHVFVQPTDLSVTNQDSWLPRSIEIDQKPGRKFRLGPLLQQRGRRTINRFPCLLTPPEGWADSFQGVRWGVCPWVGSRGWHRWSAHPFGGGVCRGGVPVLCFCSWLLRGGQEFCIVVHSSPQLPMHTVIFSFSVFCCWRTCLCRCKHHSKGSQVSSPPRKKHRGPWLLAGLCFAWVWKQRTLKNSETCAQHSLKQCSQSGSSDSVNILSYSHKKTL